MALFVPIIASRLQVRGLFASPLALDLYSRGAACLVSAFDLHVPTTSFTDDSGTWADWFQVHICFPDSWGSDAGFPFVLRVSLPISLSRGGGPTVSAKVRLTSGGTELVLPTSAPLVRTWPDGDVLPVGPTSLTVQALLSGGTDPYIQASRVWGENGPDCWYGALQGS